MTIEELRTQMGDKINPILEWDSEVLDYLYLALHNRGCRIENIQSRINNKLRLKIKEETTKRC